MVPPLMQTSLSDPSTQTADYIRSLQEGNGGIPWFKDGILDPWDHIEAAMGLASCGYINNALRAYDFLSKIQSDSGGWYASYQAGNPKDDTRMESNFVAYAATGVWHLYLVTRDNAIIDRFWPMISKAINFVVGLQGPLGEIYWAVDSVKGLQKDALVTGCSSIYHSLGCAIAMAEVKGIDCKHWIKVQADLKHAILNEPEAFDRTWASKARFSMDWFYPVLTGVLTGAEAKARIDQRWDEFVVDQLGCRCVSDEPWVTVAESCELVMALMNIHDEVRAREIFNWIQQLRDKQGAYWTGYVYRDQAIWPEEQTSWTAGAVLLASDAIEQRSGGHRLFKEVVTGSTSGVVI
ncbi:MAG: prenyltransferase [Proteobacteria bacterium]|jgi:hypothetical protein|nr:prenyltransferase [Pseudomonadota bacterium]MDA0958707.1 prenyltransferase [Pseudomonadota bacterium]MDA1206409.1 prenyltransferase [Pseudomonadota bacterium]